MLLAPIVEIFCDIDDFYKSHANMYYREQGKYTGLYYLDSTKMVVCHNRRIYRNKVFKGIAEREHCAVTWIPSFSAVNCETATWP